MIALAAPSFGKEDLSDDSLLLENARRGQAAAFTQLFSRHIKLVVRVLSRILGSHDPAVADLASQAMQLSFERLDELEAASSFGAFLAAVSVNLARNHLRAERRKRWLLFGVDSVDAPTADVTEAREALAATYEVLATLPDDLRICFALRYIDGRALNEVSQLTGVSLATAKRKLKRAESEFTAIARKHPVLSGWLSDGSRWE